MRDVTTEERKIFARFSPEMKRLREQALNLEEMILEGFSSQQAASSKQKTKTTLQSLDLMVQTLAALEEVFERLAVQAEPNLQTAIQKIKLQSLRDRLEYPEEQHLQAEKG
ncbi:hypothetical protein AVO44_03840 [Ruegeria profundi]|uniref:Uncharacterized protein n=2 Tax=Ruegeria profundi TaxID=1685378 RepID=A0A0X3TZ17_9RHOB|nr:hypothetical protein AVO44_03840 [Ruegeria profundi]